MGKASPKLLESLLHTVILTDVEQTLTDGIELVGFERFRVGLHQQSVPMELLFKVKASTRIFAHTVVQHVQVMLSIVEHKTLVTEPQHELTPRIRRIEVHRFTPTDQRLTLGF